MYFCNKHDLDKFMQPVIRHSFVSFPRNAKPKVSQVRYFMSAANYVYGR